VTNARTGVLRTRLLGVGLVLAVTACGDGASVTTTPIPAPPTPVPPTPTPAALVIQGQEAVEAPVARGGTRVVKWDFTTPAAGTVDVTISYLYDDSQILVWVTDRLCNKWQFERDECSYLTKSLEGPRPRRLTATGAKAGGYSLFVANDGPNDEQIGYQVMLTPSASGLGRLTVGPPASFSRP
jgi:hypothetical protein